MANYRIGLDFGTSQTKVCTLDLDNGVRDFVRFSNGSYFLPSVISKTKDNCFVFGEEVTKGKVYRYFKMAAAEDDDIIQSTFQNTKGVIEGEMNNYRKYSSDTDIKPEVLVIVYLAYILLFIKEEKANTTKTTFGGRLGRLLGASPLNEKNFFSINLGIPTEWNNPNHIKRRIKFETLLYLALKISERADKLDILFKTQEKEIHKWVEDENNRLNEILYANSDLVKDSKSKLTALLRKNNLAVFPESAAGVTYLLKTKRLANGSYATLDIGAGTSDVAIFEVRNNKLKRYCCSQSAIIGANDFYRNYVHIITGDDANHISFDKVKAAENQVLKDEIESDIYNQTLNLTRGNNDNKGLEYVLRTTYYIQYYSKLITMSNQIASAANERLNNCPIIVYGGGAKLDGLCSGEYCFFLGSNPYGTQNKYFIPKPIEDFIQQVDILDSEAVMEHINLLTLSLGLSYFEINDDFIPEFFDLEDQSLVLNEHDKNERYFYYDVQDAVYK